MKLGPDAPSSAPGSAARSVGAQSSTAAAYAATGI